MRFKKKHIVYKITMAKNLVITKQYIYYYYISAREKYF